MIGLTSLMPGDVLEKRPGEDWKSIGHMVTAFDAQQVAEHISEANPKRAYGWVDENGDIREVSLSTTPAYNPVGFVIESVFGGKLTGRP